MVQYKYSQAHDCTNRYLTAFQSTFDTVCKKLYKWGLNYAQIDTVMKTRYAHVQTMHCVSAHIKYAWAHIKK